MVGAFSYLSWLYGLFHMRLNSASSLFVRLRPPQGLPGGRSRFGGLNGLTLILAKWHMCMARYWPSGMMPALPQVLRNNGCPTEDSHVTRVNGRPRIIATVRSSPSTQP